MRVCILGSGPGGYVAAIRAAQLGAEVIVIEKDEVGGTCLNWGCIPTKALLASCEMLAKFRRLDEYGIDIQGDIFPRYSKIIDRKNRIVSTQIKGIRTLFKTWGISLTHGRGRIVSARDIIVEPAHSAPQKITSDTIMIGTGSRPFEMPAFPFDHQQIISSDDVLSFSEVPKSLLIIGGGIIGCEFATIFREMGCDVTIIEMLPRLVPTEDHEISALLEREMKKKHVRFITGMKVEALEKDSDTVRAVLREGNSIVAEKALVAVGRSFNTEHIGLEESGIAKGDFGEIKVNGRMETNVQGVYAIGDVTGVPMLAHAASAEGITAAENIMGRSSTMEYCAIPSVIFTFPEIASVGLKEHEAVEKGFSIITGHFPFRALGKAHAIGEISGICKVIADSKTDRVLGVHIIGPHASDIIHEGVLAVRHRLTVRQISETIHAHPTLSEGLKEASDDILGHSIHLPKRAKPPA